MRFEDWKFAAAAAMYTTPFLRLAQPGNNYHIQGEHFANLCWKFHVPLWRTQELFKHGQFWYQRSDDRKGVMTPFEDWECTTVDEETWTSMVESAPEDYVSSYLHTLVNPQHPERFAQVESAVIELHQVNPYETWLESLNAKSRYHVKQGQVGEYETRWHSFFDDQEIEFWLNATAGAHVEGALHAQSLFLWCLARQAYFVELHQDGKPIALAGFIKDGGTWVFGCNIRAERVPNVGQRLLAEAVRTLQGYRIDLTEKTVFGEEEAYGVYKSKLGNATMTKYCVASAADPEGFVAPYYLRKEGRWLTEGDTK